MRKVTQAPDVDRLWAFEQASWPAGQRATREDLLKRLREFPEGIFLLEEDGRDVSQVTVSPKRIPSEGIQGFEQMRDEPVDRSSRMLWVTNLATREGERGKGHLTELLRHVWKWAKEAGYEIVMTGLSCYGLKDAMDRGEVKSAKEYADRGMNPAVRALKKVAGEFKQSDPISGYWEEDSDSLGYGVIVEIPL